MITDPDILIVIATTVCVFAVSSVIAGWVERRWPIVSLISLSIGVGLFAYLHLRVTDGLAPIDIPFAFIHVVAMVVN